MIKLPDGELKMSLSVILYDGLGENPSLIKGFDNSRKVKNVIFDNVVINGQRMTDLNGFVKNEFVEDIRVR